MIPVQLTIKGLYSYREAQTINFEIPISAGLFGIFGGVGSGKSALLEAILFVLYDRSDRLNKAGDNRLYNMLNLQSNELIIDFIFLAGENHDSKYRFYFKAARKKNDFQKVERKDRSYYQWKNQTWQPLENIQDASHLLGMNYDNFRQTVIIPQGKFREFIDLKPTARTQMLKELFHLEQFDLSAPTGILLSQTRHQLSRIEGRLEEIGPIADHAVDEITKQLKELEEAIDQMGKRQQVLQVEEVQYQKLKELFEKINNAAERLDALQNDQDLFDQKERQLAKYEKAYSIFKEKLNQFHELLDEMKKKKEQISSLSLSIEDHDQKLIRAQNNFNSVNALLEKKDFKYQQGEDLKVLIAIKVLERQMTAINQKSQRAASRVEDQKEKCARFKKDIEKLEQSVLDQSISELTDLQQVHHWWERQNENQSLQMKLQKHLQQYQQQLDRIEQRRIVIIKKLPIALRELDQKEITKNLKAIIDKLDDKINQLNVHRNELQVKQELVHYSEKIEEGKPCPLCGATHHPSVIELDSVQKEIEKDTGAINGLESKKKDWQQWLREYHEIELEIRSSNQLLQQKTQEHEQTLDQIRRHKQAFAWKKYAGLDPGQVHRMLEKVIAEQSESESKRLKLKKLRDDLTSAEQQLLQDQDSWHLLQKQVLQQEAAINAQKQLIGNLDFKKYQSHSLSRLKELLKKSEQQMAEMESKYKQAEQLLKTLQSEQQHRKGQLQAEEKSWRLLETKVQTNDENIRALIKKQDFKDVQTVQKILSLNLNVAQERKAIENYRQERFAVENTLVGLQREAGKKKYLEGNHLNLIHEIKQLDEQIQTKKEMFAIKRQEKSQLKIKLNLVKDLNKTKQQQEERKDQLRLLAQLFKGQGFVNYVSTIYLQNLCELANKRFLKLTQNTLSLELSQYNEFVIRDYLNEGKTRLLKTLSGGQTFQAALCLALALAENVKSLNQSEQSFFFLDEGFGSLDKASLRVVFETLKALRKENRIVGIISHIEELQQEIDIYLQIDHDKERGSLVQYSWQ